MASSDRVKKHKHFVLDQAKIECARESLGAQTEKGIIERASEEVIAERERDCRS